MLLFKGKKKENIFKVIWLIGGGGEMKLFLLSFFGIVVRFIKFVFSLVIYFVGCVMCF